MRVIKKQSLCSLDWSKKMSQEVTFGQKAAVREDLAESPAV